MSLMPRLLLGELELTSWPFGVAWGRDYGNPQNAMEALISSLPAGDVLSRTRIENREISLTVYVEGATLHELAENEARLVAECDKDRNTLLVDPGDAFGAASVFETFCAQVEMAFDDDGEIALMRRYELTIPALPHVRDEFPTVSPAVPIVAATVVDDGSATTNWTAPDGPSGAAVSVASGAVTVAYNPNLIRTTGSTYGATLRRGGLSLVGKLGHYFAVDWKSSVAGAQPKFNINDDSSRYEVEVRREPLAGGYVRSYFTIPVDSVSSFRVLAVHPQQASGSASLSVDQVQVMQAPPGISTTRQLLRSVQVGGSVNTQGSIEVVHPTAGLGDVIVYTYKAEGGYQPALSPWTSDASDVFFTDATTIAGGYWNLATTYRWSVPVTALPSGEAVLIFRAHNTEPGDCKIEWAAFSEMNGTILGTEAGNFMHNFATANVQETIVVPVPLNLPTVPLGPGGKVLIDLRRLSVHGPGATYMHEAWLFSTKGALSIVSAGTRKRFVVRAPSLDEPQGSMWVGDSADGSDWYSVSASSVSRQHHVLEPGENCVFTVTTGAGNAEVSAEHYNRHHTHAAEVS